MSNQKYYKNEIIVSFSQLLLAENTAKGHPALLDVDKAYLKRLDTCFGSPTFTASNTAEQLADAIIKVPQQEETGICECIYEPRGDNGLEGFNIKEEYKYEKKIRLGELGGNSVKPKAYYRVYLDSEYYECCNSGVFKKFFEIKKEKK